MSAIPTLSKIDHPRYRYRVYFTNGAERLQKYFKKKTGEGGADEFIEAQLKRLSDEGTKEKAITDAEARAVKEFREAVAKLPGKASKATLAEAVGFYLKSLEARHKSITCQVIADRLLLRLQAEGTGKPHQATMEYRLKKFLAAYGDWKACDFSPEIIDSFLSAQNVGLQTRKHYRAAIYQLFQHAVILNAATENPVTKAMKIRVKTDEPGILKPAQVAALLSHCDDDTLPGLAISFFAGVRRAEIERLDWSEIDLKSGLIEIKAAKAKTAQRRFIAISENLKAWLAPHAATGGKVIVSPAIWRKGQEKARLDAGIADWPHNAGRHSFASYHLALNEDPGKLAMELGHPDPRLLFSRYRTLVSKKSAASFWNVTPEKSSQITELKSA